MLTIVIASYGYGHLAAHCIETVLAQTLSPEKILFVDDGAKDCLHLPSFYPQLDYVFRETNFGIVDNFQDMLLRVNTQYVMFLGADNWLRSDAVELLSLQQTDIVTYDIVVTGELKEEIIQRVPGKTHPYHGDLYWDRQGGHHGSMMYKTAIGKKIGYSKNQTEHPQEDWNLWDEMINLGASVSSVNQGLLYYRRHKENFLKYSLKANLASMQRQGKAIQEFTEAI